MTSKSCEPDVAIDRPISQETQQVFMQQEVKNEFESDILYEDRLMVFGERARQKMLDFVDYLNLYAYKHTDTLLKLQVKDIVYRLFYEQDARIQLSSVNKNARVSYPPNLDGLFDYINASPYESIRFAISELNISEPLHPDSDEKYTGKLHCSISISGIAGNDTILISRNNIQVKNLVTLTNKQFGENKSLIIWQVFLAEIESVR